MDKILAPIKQRIFKYLENQNIKKEFFYKKTDISPSNFKGKALESEIGGDKIANILSIFEDISPDWLLNGKGEMLRDFTDPKLSYYDMQERIRELKYTIELQKAFIEELRRKP